MRRLLAMILVTCIQAPMCIKHNNRLQVPSIILLLSNTNTNTNTNTNSNSNSNSNSIINSNTTVVYRMILWILRQRLPSHQRFHNGKCIILQKEDPIITIERLERQHGNPSHPNALLYINLIFKYRIEMTILRMELLKGR